MAYTEIEHEQTLRYQGKVKTDYPFFFFWQCDILKTRKDESLLRKINVADVLETSRTVAVSTKAAVKFNPFVQQRKKWRGGR